MAPERTAAIMAAATAGAFLIGSVATIQLWMVRAVRSTSAAAIAEEAAIVEEAVMAAAATEVAIDAAGYRKSSGFLVRRKRGFFRFILVCVTHHFGIT
jgi:uncharacterized membrane protein